MLEINNFEYTARIFTVFAFALGLFAITAQVMGRERKEKWFRKRTKYTLFTRRSIIGEFVHYGYPCTLEGGMVFVFLFASVFSFGYWYIFIN